MANTFKAGDMVQLKSGGPPMTIDGVPGEGKHYAHKGDEYWCTWFKGATREEGSFGEHVLQRYEPLKK
jgi:uncharacterized protein YodC (DUF2158 family)